MRFVLIACLGVAQVLAGCAARESTGPVAGDDDTPSFPAFDAVEAITNCSDCWEPSIAVDTTGRIFAVTGFDQLLGVSDDGGRTFEQLTTPPLPTGAPDGAFPGDAIVDSGPDGRVYYLAFMGRFDTPLVPIPEGLHVASSGDGGQTWDANSYLSILDDTRETVVTPWKCWLALGPGGETYVAYALRPGGVWVARSDDQGATFGSWTHATPPPDRLQNAFIGYPAVLPDGRLLIPHWGDQMPGVPPPFAVTSHALRIAISDDRAASFRHVDVMVAAPPTTLGRGFPILAQDNETLVLAYQDASARIQVRTSQDRGETWSNPTPWSGEFQSGHGVWVAAAKGELAVMFVDADSSDLRYARGPTAAAAAGPVVEGVIVAGVGVNGDFPQFGLLPDGRMAAVWSDLDSRVFVAVGP